jgi:hypothetical protein
MRREDGYLLGSVTRYAANPDRTYGTHRTYESEPISPMSPIGPIQEQGSARPHYAVTSDTPHATAPLVPHGKNMHGRLIACYRSTHFRQHNRLDRLR